jgi:hypothetical protein
MSVAGRMASLRTEPVLPPGFSLTTLRESGDAFAVARRIAPESGAGSLVWTRRFEILDVAVVLEPEEPLATARLAHYIGMNALADCLAALVPPEKPLVFDWPDAVLLDGGLLGGGRTAWPEATAEDATPEWLVFGLMVRTASLDVLAPGEASVGVTMEDEGIEDIDPAALVESFARHLMLGVDEWTRKGPKAVARRFLDRLERHPVQRRAIAPSGDLWIDGEGPRVVRDFREALARAAWLDADGTAPRW